MIEIEIFFQGANRQNKMVNYQIKVDKGSTVYDALNLCGLKTHYPDLQLGELVIGIYSKKVTLETPLKNNDRIEIYQSLIIDPKTARKNRAAKKKQ